jgi:dTDP-4-amino-4,6-dideoxygalactose transaminase
VVPFLDLKTQYSQIASEMEPAVLKVLSGGNYILGDEVRAFEREFASFLGVKHAISVSSGLDALRLALLAADVKPGDEVITAANTFIATALAITTIGAKLVMVDPDDETANIEASAIAKAITPRTKAIIPVHLYGLPARMGPIMELARERNLTVIEDACQAHGAKVDGVRAGTQGAMACFSFYPGKNLGAAGDGGLVTTGDDKLAARLQSLRNYGQEKKYYHSEIGYNHRLDEIQAAVLRIKLKRLDAWNGQRAANAAAYTKGLAGLPIETPKVPEGRTHIFHLYVIRTDRRDELQAHLTARGVSTLIHYPVPIHLQQAYRSLGLGPGSFPISERMAGRILSLPMFPELTAAQTQEVVEGVRAFFVK